MGNLLFSPSGRIGSGQFMSGATILIAIGLVLGVLPIFVPVLALLNIVGLVLFWCWIVLWVKRYHDGGKSGWMCLIPIIVYLILGGIITFVLTQMFTDPEAAAAAAEAAAEAAENGDFGAMFKLAGGGAGVSKMGLIIVQVVSAVISYLIAMVFNNLIKHDAHDNQFGPEAGTA